MKVLTTALIVALAGASSAMGAVVPNDRAAVAGNGGFLSPLANSARSYQMVIDESQLVSLVGQQINGIAFRALPGATVAWPAADTTYNNYDIYVGQSVDPSLRTTTFANNVIGPQTQVRSGSLTIPAGSYTVGSSPNGFAPHITFSIPYAYLGGDLAIEIRQDGSNGTSLSTDAVTASSGPGSGYNVNFGATWISGYFPGATGSNGNFTIIDLSVVPAPSSAALLGLGLIAAGRRRR